MNKYLGGRKLAVADKFRSIIDFLTSGFEDKTDIYETLSDDSETMYPVQGTTALNPARTEERDLKVVSHPNYKGYE